MASYPSAGQNVQGYSYSLNNNGGVNYFHNGTPITNTQYRASGIDTNAIEADAAKNFAAVTAADNQEAVDTHYYDNINSSPVATRSGVSTQAQLDAAAQAQAQADAQARAAAEAAQAQATADAQTKVATNGILGEIAGLNSGLADQRANNQTSYQSVIDKNNAQDQAIASQKDESLNNNDLSYLASQQSSLVNSAKLRQSLLSTLTGMGALNGSGIGLASGTIGGALQNDLSGANGNYATNANSVLSAYNNYDIQAKARKDAADEQLRLSNIGAENSFATNKQNYLQQLAGLYPTGSNQGAEYLNQAFGLGNQIQATTSPAQFDTSAIPAASFSAPDLAKYLSGTNQLSVGGPSPSSGVGSFYTTNKKRTDLTAPLSLTTGN